MDPILDPKLRYDMNALAAALDELFEGRGFALLVFDFGENPGRRLNYISNAQRDDMLVALKEFIAVHEGRMTSGGSA